MYTIETAKSFYLETIGSNNSKDKNISIKSLKETFQEWLTDEYDLSIEEKQMALTLLSLI